VAKVEPYPVAGVTMYAVRHTNGQLEKTIGGGIWYHDLDIAHEVCALINDTVEEQQMPPPPTPQKMKSFINRKERTPSHHARMMRAGRAEARIARRNKNPLY